MPCSLLEVLNPSAELLLLQISALVTNTVLSKILATRSELELSFLLKNKEK
jgi:hypothetical protein